jgi:serine/threonine protein kinase
VSSSGRACLADFGLASIRDSQVLRSSPSADSEAMGTTRWQAPELLDPCADSRGTTLACDVYSFACVCFEVNTTNHFLSTPIVENFQVFSGNIPFFEIENNYAASNAAMRGERPTRPPPNICNVRGLDDRMWALTQRCWNEHPSERPTATEIVSIISGFPHHTAGHRPIDEWDDTLPSRLSYFLAEHPFSSTFADIIGDTFVRHGMTGGLRFH